MLRIQGGLNEEELQDAILAINILNDPVELSTNSYISIDLKCIILRKFYKLSKSIKKYENLFIDLSIDFLNSRPSFRKFERFINILEIDLLSVEGKQDLNDIFLLSPDLLVDFLIEYKELRKIPHTMPTTKKLFNFFPIFMTMCLPKREIKLNNQKSIYSGK